MRFFMSGTPRNDEHQDKEDGLCTHRLFSLHGEYKRAVLRWVQNAVTEMDRSNTTPTGRAVSSSAPVSAMADASSAFSCSSMSVSDYE